MIMGLRVIGSSVIALSVIGAILIGQGNPGVIGLSHNSKNFENLSGQDSAGPDLKKFEGYYPEGYYQGGLLGLLRMSRTSPRL